MSHTIGKWVRFRIALVVIGLILLGTVICGRFFYLQVVKGPQLRELATREYQKFCPILPVRGMIVDRKGLELAISTRVSSVVAHPLQIKQANRLSREENLFQCLMETGFPQMCKPLRFKLHPDMYQPI